MEDYYMEIKEKDGDIKRITQKVLENEDDFSKYRNKTQEKLLEGNIKIEDLTKTILQLDNIIDGAQDVYNEDVGSKNKELDERRLRKTNCIWVTRMEI